MCKFETNWIEKEDQHDSMFEGLERMSELEDGGLIERTPFQLKVTEKGRPFIRNICLALDSKYWKKKPDGALFSQVV